MVGIPGKSQGCNTCRRRKIRCNMEKPECGQCIKSNRVCEGYIRDATFINRTAEGLQRRGKTSRSCDGRAETRKNQCSASTKSHTRKIPTTALKCLEQVSHELGIECQDLLHAGTIYIHPKIDTMATYSETFLGKFLTAYLPTGSTSSLKRPSWLQIVVSTSTRTPALDAALRALSLTKLARAFNNRDLLTAGMRAHGEALRVLQAAISDPDQASEDQTSAAARVLATYELHESTMGSHIGWIRHEEGVDRLVLNRGPTAFKSPLGQVILEDSRRSALIRGLQTRRSSFFLQPQWLTEPWADRPKSPAQKLYDIGLHLPALLEALDAIPPLSISARAQYYASLLNQARKLDADLEQWFCHVTLTSESPLYSTQTAPSQSLDDITVTYPFYAYFSFPDIQVADMMVEYWAVRLLVLVPQHLLLPPAAAVLLNPRIWQYAVNISMSVPYFTSEGAGYLGLHYIMFPLRVALEAFKRAGKKREEQWSTVTLEKLTEKGVLFGRHVPKMREGVWNMKEQPLVA